MTYRWQQDVAAFLRRLAIQQIGYWRDNKRKGLPKTAADARRQALAYLEKAKGLENEIV